MRHLLLIILTIGILSRLSAQDISDVQLDSVILGNKIHNFNGVVMIAKGQKIIYQKAFGWRNRETKSPLNVNSQFVIGSVSKQITATLILQQVDKGKINLNASLGEYLPDLKSTWKNAVQIQHLLNHTSGISELDKPLMTIPGEKFQYSNLGYQLLGQILENVTGKTLESLAASLFQYCRMHQSTASLTAPALVTGYNEKETGELIPEKPLSDKKSIPSGGMISTLRDLMLWQNFLHTGKLLSATSYQKMITPYTKRSHRWGDIGYGFGIQINNQDGLTELSHNGYVPGFIATAIYYPESQTSIILLENISWFPSDMKKVFIIHDEIRKIIRGNLLDK